MSCSHSHRSPKGRAGDLGHGSRGSGTECPRDQGTRGAKRYRSLHCSANSFTGHLKAVWPEMSGSVFDSAKLGPKTLLDRRGSSCSAGCTTNQPRRTILRPFRGANKIRPDCCQVPSFWVFRFFALVCLRSRGPSGRPPGRPTDGPGGPSGCLPKLYEFIGLGGSHGHKPYNFYKVWWQPWPHNL